MLASTAADRDPGGDVWHLWDIDGLSTMRRLKMDVRGLFFYCKSDSFYMMQRCNGTQTVISLGATTGWLTSKNKIAYAMGVDCLILAPEMKYLTAESMNTSFDMCFSSDGNVAVQRLYSEWYFGFDFKPPEHNPRNPYSTWWGYQCPRGDLRPGGGIVKPKGFDEFAVKLRREIAERSGESPRRISVLAVFLDADNDGDADAYIAFANDRTKGGNFRWTLYLNDSGVYSQPGGPVYPVPARKELCELSPSVVAPTNGICRVLRFDVDPTFLILDGKGSPTKVRDAITNVLAHRVEKLPCVEIGED